jgi:hypothetical protein
MSAGKDLSTDLANGISPGFPRILCPKMNYPEHYLPRSSKTCIPEDDHGSPHKISSRASKQSKESSVPAFRLKTPRVGREKFHHERALCIFMESTLFFPS